jgi:DNA helicase-2/ATP-dependent DNA helicase PcrA
MGHIDYAGELNPAQLEAVMTLDGPVLVIAGAGSGKTRTLTYRVANLVERGVHPRNVLLLTFTRKASSEMLERAQNLLDARCGEVSGGTFHSYAHLVLRRHAREAGFTSRFSVLDQSDAESLVEAARDATVPKAQRKGFPRKQTVMAILSKAVNKGVSIPDVLAGEFSHFMGYANILEQIQTRYTALKREQDAMDFDDLLLHTGDLLERNPAAREAVAGRHTHIMVDEYQDTNHLQARILRQLACAHDNVMAVGDDCQSIYAFRGANFENIMRFPEVFPGTKIIRLEENYRSTQPILSVGNALVRQAKRKYAKNLFTRAEGGETPLLVGLDSENSQSDFVVGEIKHLLDSGTPPGEIAVLFRAGYLAFDLEVELARAKLPFVKYGGFKFTESGHVKDFLAFLRVLAYPGDWISWNRLLLMLDKVGPKSALGIFQQIKDAGKGVRGILDVKPKPAFAAGFEAMQKLYAALDPESEGLARTGAAVLEHYLPTLRERHDNWPKREKDLRQVVVMMERYPSLEPFLSDMALDPPSTSVDNGLAEGRHPERLVLSTIHSAKGLEWDAVFVIWALDGRLPSSQSVFRKGDALEEELRLLYVAATRARKKLVFTYPRDVYDHAAGQVLYDPCRFLDGIGRDILARG